MNHYENANKILSVLAHKSAEMETLNRTADMSTPNDYVLRMMEIILGNNEQELQRNEGKVLEYIKRTQGQTFGIVNFGTGLACEVAGVIGEAGQAAIRELKAQERILQCGKGRGKCLIILDATPLGSGNEEEHIAIEDAVAEPAGELSVSDMLRTIREEWRNMEKTKNALEKEILSLKTTVEEKDQRIQELNQQLSVMNMATWQ